MEHCATGDSGAMKNPTLSGLLLIAGAVAGVLVMLSHPTAHDLMTAADPGRRAAGNVAVHSVALATLPMLFLGLSGLTRRLLGCDLSLAALVLYGFGAVATVPAAVMSGFVATDLILDMHGAGAASRELSFALLRFAGLVNRGFFACAVVAVSLAILLWSAAILRGRRLSRGAGIVGVVVGAAIPIGLLSGQLGLDIHGVGIITGAQSVWYVWIGILLVRAGRGAASGDGG
jgi:hypothetical protein